MEYYKNLNIEDIDGELWQDIPLYDGIYQASNYGRIKRVERMTSNGRLLKEKIMKQHIAKSTGTLHLAVGMPGQKKRCRTVCSLVGLAFLGLRDDYEVFTRRNKNKLDNRLCNIIKTNRSESELLDYKYGKTKADGFVGIPHKGGIHRNRNNKGIYTSAYLYHSTLGTYTRSQLIEKYGRSGADSIYNATRIRCRSMGVQWTKIKTINNQSNKQI